MIICNFVVFSGENFLRIYNWFSMIQFLPKAHVTKLLLDSAHDAMPYYEYCRDHGIVPFIDLNADRGRPPVYKDDFTINDGGVLVRREGHSMRRDGKGRTKFKCPKISFAGGNWLVPAKIHVRLLKIECCMGSKKWL